MLPDRFNAVARTARMVAGVSFAFTVLTSVNSADAKILTVGPGQQYTTIQAAANVVRSGDTINVMPGTYSSAGFGAYNNFIIQGTAPGVVVTGDTYASKGLFVFGGSNITVKNIAFKDASSSDGNGAGIRFQGQNLNVVNCEFTNDQNGLLIDYNVFSTINVTGSVFTHDGTCVSSKGCGHGIYAGHVGALNVSNSTFSDTQAGHSIKSRANRTTIIGNTITDGPSGTASYLIDVPDSGAVTIAGNTLEKGPNATNHTAAIAIGEESTSNPAGAILIANNKFKNDADTNEFIWNKSGHDSLVAGNVLTGKSTKVLQGAGTVSAGRTVVSVMNDAGPGWLQGGSDAQSAVQGYGTSAANDAGATPVPEPNMLALFGTGLVGLGLFVRKRRQP